jgi:hypothetical protein
MSKKAFSSIAISVVVTVLIVVAFSLYIYHNSLSDVKNLARLSSLVFSLHDIENVQVMLEKGVSPDRIVSSDSYLRVYNKLLEINKIIPSKIRWTYIFGVGGQLYVLTIPYEELEPSTHPGYRIEYALYPAVVAILDTDAEMVVSNIVWDKEYSFLTRSIFIKLYSGDDWVGVLGFDIKSDYVIYEMILSFFITLTLAGVLMLVGLQLSIGFGVVLSQRQYDKYVRECV